MYEIDKKTGGIMYCYRGIKYNKTDKKQAKAKTGQYKVYRGVKVAA